MSEPQARVLIVDDDTRLLTSLSRGLGLRGFAVEAVDSPGKAVSLLEARWPDVMILDVLMPGMDGVSFCRLVRTTFAVPILMLTARDAVEDRVAGLEAGADDYLVKPFALDELVARLRALVRRPGIQDPSKGHLSYAGLVLDRRRWTATRDGEPLALTATQFRLLEALMKEPERVISREELLEHVWGDGSGFESNVVDVHITNLRRKLESGRKPRIVQTVRGAGVQLKAP